MARGINKVTLVGNLGQDPDTRYIPDGTAVCSFTMAATDTYKDKTTGEQKEVTEWVTVEAWGKLAEVCSEYLSKGKQIYVEGQLKTDSWEDKETGQKKYRTKVRANDVLFLGNRPQRGPSAPQATEPNKGQDFEDDIPF